MKNSDIAKRFKTRFIINLLIAAFLTLLAEAVIISCLSAAGGWAGVISAVSAIVIFILIFFLLERKSLGYIEELSHSMREMADGDLSVRLEIEGTDEFAQMAEDLNTLGQRLTRLIEFEREAEQSRTELITNIAHDLKTPLTSIIGYLDLLGGRKADALSPDQRRKYTSIAYTKARRLESLINDLFDFSKLSYGKINMNVGYVDIVKLLSQLLEESYPSFVERGLSYELKSNVPSLEITADAGLLARLFDNLIANAIKYGSDGKKVLVRVNAEEDNDIVEVQVINYGFIIEDKDLPYIFDKFYRADSARSTSTGGTGLGLAIARDIVTMHSGTISAKSDLQGTVFTVRLKIHFDKNKENLRRA